MDAQEALAQSFDEGRHGPFPGGGPEGRSGADGRSVDREDPAQGRQCGPAPPPGRTKHPVYVGAPDGTGQVGQQAWPVAQHAQHLQHAEHSQHAQETGTPPMALGAFADGYIEAVPGVRGRCY